MIRHSFAVCIVLTSTLPLFAQQANPVDSAGASRVSMNQVWNSLPDFVCKERIVSRLIEKGKTKEEFVMESLFMAQRKTQTRADGSSVYSIVESRDVIASTFNRKPLKKGAVMPAAPLLFDGLAANILFVADVPRYHVLSAETLEGRLTVRIGYTAKDSREFLQLEFPAAVSNVQIDTESTKALHLESRFGLRYGGSGIPVAVDFESIEIDGKLFWMPRLVKAEAIASKTTTLTYVAEYTNCKKFEVSVQIRAVAE